MKKNHLLTLLVRTALITASLVSPLVFADASAKTKQEVTHLFTHLISSGCEFNRNGSWYSAADAAAHLNKKYAYLIEKNLIASAEDFIENAATKSSMSGKAYQVKCANATPVDSARWFKDELAKYRKTSAAGGAISAPVARP
jgi:Family of unknown function (DUF5329)